MKINLDAIKARFGRRAKTLAQDPERAKALLEQAMRKAEGHRGPLEELWDSIQLLFALVKDWASGNYREVPIGSIIAMIIGLLYFVSIIDFVPDLFLGGLVDDAAVLGIVIKQVAGDLNRYRWWRENRSA